MARMRKEYEEVYRDYEDNHFYFVARKRLILRLIQAHFPKNQPLKILDVGCGTGNVLNYLSQYLKGTFTGLDTSPEMLRRNKNKHFHLVRGILHKPPFPKESFDVVLCLEVLEHLKNDLGALHVLPKLLKKRGLFLLSVPAFPFLWSAHDDLNKHYRRYSYRELKQKLSTIPGIKKIYYWNAVSFFPKIFARLAFSKRKIRKGSSDIEEPLYTLAPINWAVKQWLNIENGWICHNLPLPFGSSLVAIVEKR